MRRPASTQRRYIVPVLCCLLAFGLYLYKLDVRPLWWDEGISVYRTPGSLSEFVQRTMGDVHPPAYHLLLEGWIGAFGASPFAIRALSVWTGTVAVAALYVAGRRLGGGTVGVLSALLGASAPFMAHYARDTRMYSLGMALVVLSSYTFMRLLEGRASAGWWALYVGCLCLGLYTQYVFALVPVGQALAVGATLWQKRGAVRRLRPWLIAWGVVAVVYAPWLACAASRIGFVGGRRLGSLSMGEMPLVFEKLVLGYAPDYPPTLLGRAAKWAIVSGFVALALVGSIDLYARRHAGAIPLTFTVVGALLFVALTRYAPEEGQNRVVKLAFAGVPPLLLLVSAGLGRVYARRQWAGAILTLVLVVGTGSSVLAAYDQPVDAAEDYRPLIAQLRALARPGDAAMTAYIWQDGYLESYAPDVPLTLYRLAYDATSAPELLDGILRSHERVWIVNYQADVHDLGDPLNAWLYHHALPVMDAQYGSTQLALFVRPKDLPAEWSSRATFEQGLSIEYEPLSVTVQPGDVLTLNLRWQVGSSIDRAYAAFLHLGRPDAPPIAQNDRVPALRWRPGEPVIDQRALLVPLDAPPGEVWLYVGVYDPVRDSRLGVMPSGGSLGCDTPDRVCIGRIKVVADRG